MIDEDRDLRDDVLRRRIREVVGGRQAPESWVREALAVPARSAAPARVRREPLLVVLLPHLAGIALLVGFVVSVFLRPDAFEGMLEPLARAVPAGSLDPAAQRLCEAGFATTALVAFLYQGARGFPILRRLHLIR